MKTIPIFPEFRVITLKDKKLFDDYFRLIQPKISEYTFANLYIWRNILQIKISLLYENICMQMLDFHGQRIFPPFIGGRQLKASVDACLNYAKREWKEVSFGLYTQDQLDVFKIYYPTAKIAVDRQASDYIYNAADLINLRGKKYDGKRNSLRKFKLQYDYSYKKLGAKNLAGCHSLLDHWTLEHCEDWKCSLSIKSEVEACRQALDNYQVLGLLGGVIEIDKKVAAFSLGEQLNADTMVVHFEKSDGLYKGVAAAINQEYAARACKNFKYVNREEDLGEPGLRANKLSYQPAFLVDKYYVTF